MAIFSLTWFISELIQNVSIFNDLVQMSWICLCNIICAKIFYVLIKSLAIGSAALFRAYGLIVDIGF